MKEKSYPAHRITPIYSPHRITPERLHTLEDLNLSPWEVLHLSKSPLLLPPNGRCIEGKTTKAVVFLNAMSEKTPVINLSPYSLDEHRHLWMLGGLIRSSGIIVK